MSICLPNLRSTSVFKVYYGGTGVTTLTSGAVIIGNGTDAVQCITGSEGQVLTWDSTSGSWVAKNPTGGTGGGTGVGNVPDIVIAPADNTPTKVTKKRFANDFYKNKHKLVDWDNTSKGSFRMSPYDPAKKYVTVYNDSDKDLFISVADDENPKIIIDFENKNDINDLRIKYIYKTGSSIETLFEYGINEIKDIHSSHSYSSEPTKKYGYGKDYSLNECSNFSRLTIYLTPDYFSEILNKDVECYINMTGSYEIFLSNSSGLRTPKQQFNVSCSIYNFDQRHQQQYTIYTKISGNTFISSSYTTSSNYTSNINGFDLSGLDINNRQNAVAAPEDYSYILYSQETLTLSEQEAKLAMFGYFIDPGNKLGIIRVTEAR